VELSLTEQDGVTVIALRGNVMGGPDASNLNDKLHEITQQGKKRVVVDLAGVQIMNSSGLGMLIGGLTTMRNADGDLKIARAPQKIAGLLTVAKLNTIFPNYRSVEEAIHGFNS
jgi:anti-sigma B factor antagonist